VTPAFDVVKTGRYVEDDAQIVAYGEGDVIEPDTELYVKFRDPWGVVGPWERVYSKNQLNTFGIPSEVLTDPNA
jgi:hypothetical protein